MSQSRGGKQHEEEQRDEHDLPRGVVRTQAPWSLDAEAWIFPHWTSRRNIDERKRAAAAAGKEVDEEQERDSSGEGSSSSSRRRRRNERLARAGLPPASFHPHEMLHPLALPGDRAERGPAPSMDEGRKMQQETQQQQQQQRQLQSPDEFEGGPGGWLLYRYSDSPVGPYDELIYVAGLFHSPSAASTALRITNIYVSSIASVYNGRKNWNIPKHLALFQWSEPNVHSTNAQTVQTVRVYLPERTDEVRRGSARGREIFAARLHPRASSVLSCVPLPAHTVYLPHWLNLTLCAPPLLRVQREGQAGEEAEEGRKEGLTDSKPRGVWRAVRPTFDGWARLARAEPLLSGEAGRGTSISNSSADLSYGDGIHFPKLSQTWGWGLHLAHVRVDFPIPDLLPTQDEAALRPSKLEARKSK